MSDGMTDMYKKEEKARMMRDRENARIAKRRIAARKKDITYEIGLVCLSLFELMREEACL